jgi:hypothetical protein
LGRLRARGEAPIESYLSNPIDVEQELRPLREAVSRLHAGARPDTAVRPTTLRVARQKWVSAGGRLDGFMDREIRALCGDEESATDPRFVLALSVLGRVHTRRLWLEGLVAQYLLAWRRMDEPATLERLLQDSVRAFRGRSARIARCQTNPGRLFSPESAAWLAEQILEQRADVTATLAQWTIPPSGGLGRATWEAVVRGWGDRVVRAGTTLSSAAAAEAFDYLKGTLLTSELITPAAAGRALSALVLSPVLDRDPALIDAVRGYILESPRFGDPRLPGNRGNWAACEAAAVHKVASWFSKQDLDFFFRVALPSHEDPHGRRKFWDRYLHQVVDCLVVLSSEDDRRIRAHTSERLHYARATGAPGVSAFLMRFRGATEFIVIEFSKPGNAIRIHDAEEFERQVGGMRAKRSFHVSDDLKRNGSTLTTFNHTLYWADTVAAFLAQRGIRRSA